MMDYLQQICVAILGYGVEHIKECNKLIQSINRLDQNIKIYIATDMPEMIEGDPYNIIHIKDKDFNYNLKIIPIQKCIECGEEIILYMDSDTMLRDGIDLFNIPNWLDEIGIYPIQISEHIDESDDVWVKGLKRLSEELKMIPEHLFIIKTDQIDGNKKAKEFISSWERLINYTKEIQYRKNDRMGASEGCLIWLGGKESKFTIHKKLPKHIKENVFNKIIHIGMQNHKKEKTKI